MAEAFYVLFCIEHCNFRARATTTLCQNPLWDNAHHWPNLSVGWQREPSATARALSDCGCHMRLRVPSATVCHHEYPCAGPSATAPLIAAPSTLSQGGSQARRRRDVKHLFLKVLRPSLVLGSARTGFAMYCLSTLPNAATLAWTPLMAGACKRRGEAATTSPTALQQNVLHIAFVSLAFPSSQAGSRSRRAK